MASENKTENVMLRGQSTYYRKTGSMKNLGTIHIEENPTSSHNYSEVYVGPDSKIDGTQLESTNDYISCENEMKSYLENDFDSTTEGYTVENNAKNMLAKLQPKALNIENIKGKIKLEIKKIEYFETSGASRIVVPFSGDIRYDTIKLSISDSTYQGWEYYWAVTNSDIYNARRFILDFGVTNHGTFYGITPIRSDTEGGSTSTFFNSNFHEFDLTPTIWTMDDKLTLWSGTPSTTDTTYTYIWPIWQGDQSTNNFRLKYFQIIRNDKVVLDLQPCIYDQKVCLYDTISQNFYYNTGTGTLTAGPQIKD